VNLSIHPRVRSGGKKVDTSAPQKAGGNGYRRRMEAKLAVRRLAHNATIKSLSSTTNPMAYRTPGSMRLDKR
jgi:hypothetical protein